MGGKSRIASHLHGAGESQPLHTLNISKQKLKRRRLPKSFRSRLARQGGLRQIRNIVYGRTPPSLQLLDISILKRILLSLEVPDLHALSLTCRTLRTALEDSDIRYTALENSLNRYLTRDEDDTATTYKNLIIKIVSQAYTWGEFNLTTKILAHIHCVDAYCIALVVGSEKDWIDVVQWVIPYVVGYNKAYAESNVLYLQQALLGAIRGHNWNIAFKLLKTGFVDPSFENNSALLLACEQGFVDMLELLMNHPNVDPSACDNLAIVVASAKGHLSIIKQLLTDIRVDASTQSSYSLREACENGHTQVVEYLLQLPGVDPSVHNNICVRSACKYNHIDVVKLLLKDIRVDPSDCYNEAIISAQDGGFEAIIRLLLEDLRVNKSGLSIDF